MTDAPERQATAPRAYGQVAWSWSPDAGIKSVEMSAGDGG